MFQQLIITSRPDKIKNYLTKIWFESFYHFIWKIKISNFFFELIYLLFFLLAIKDVFIFFLSTQGLIKIIFGELLANLIPELFSKIEIIIKLSLF